MEKREKEKARKSSQQKIDQSNMRDTNIIN